MSLNNRGKPTTDSGDMQKINNLIRERDSLREANKTLQNQLDQLKKEQITYLQNVAHQLVAPLNAMKWHIENLTAGRLQSSERIQKVLRSIYSQATIAVHLAKNFALMSNLEADQTLTAQREPLQPVNLKQLMVNLADDFQPLGWEKNVHISVINDPLEKAPQVLVIKNLMSQVFSNILENAVKYSSTLTEIKVYGLYNPNDDTVSVSIVSKGIPLNPADAELLFTRGYRSTEARNVYPAGTGFGLYIAKKIVDIHEGNIKAFSDDNGFTVFQVTLSVKGLQGKAVQIESKNNINSRR